MATSALSRQLSRLQNLMQQHQQQQNASMPVLDPPASEAGVLASELTAAFKSLVENYAGLYDVSESEARAKFAEPSSAYEEQMLHGPPDQVSWSGLEALARRDPELAQRRWEEIKQ